MDNEIRRKIREDVNKQIVSNLRYKYREELTKYSDNEILNVYNDWNSGDKSEDFLVWMHES